MKKGFDAVAWMRKRREEIEREDAGLTWQEKSLKTLGLLKDNPFWQRLKNRVVAPDSQASGVAQAAGKR
ncbi:MAG: hypothetical protein HYT87_05580 [Nitrospirae bacterium]|nr:hypothetical protein [Nitrospirota bacterium]